ncbi:hypothetical protein [Jiangella rhizosphaerae]|uniref:Adhesin domain-containing protein n=1 Tax=Jiangella rhizosphaerae TaxID=2293569 RepID=A0A418KI64_9ACTN|nr:hypothetical protein [Jiangella rhizosphaerae]RIQ12648.1 hypothetical protein DY240_26900 [Jiangella rhizosphaerae]
MNTLSVREILEQVADGRLDPTRAAVLLDQIEDEKAGAPTGADTAEPADAETADPVDAPAGVAGMPAGAATGAAGSGSAGAGAAGRSGSAAAGGAVTPQRITRVQVRATSRRVVIVGDPSVATVAVNGQHTVRRDGAMLHVTGESELVPGDGAFVLLAGGRWRDFASRLQNPGQLLDLHVRVNPELAVGAEVIAGSLQIDQVPALDHVRVTAGSLRARGLESPVDLLVQAGSAQVETRQLAGHSRMRCESGSLQLTLLDGSDVRIRSDVQLGRFRTVPERTGRDRDRDIVLGTGAAEIEAEVVMGDITVRLPEGAQR